MKNPRGILLAALLLSGSHAHAQDTFKTGLILPSAAEMEKYAMPPPSLTAALPARVINSTYLPPVANGNQGELGICGSICITYFTATHQLAKARGWTAPGHNGDWSKVTSPAWGVWCYSHATKNGAPWGANPLETIEEIIRYGIRSYEDFPYTGAALDVGYVPDFAERADALRWRAQSAVTISDIHSPSGIQSLKYFLSQGNIAATSTSYVDTLRNYSGANVAPNGVVVAAGAAESPGHALTIVGYDDNMSYTDPQTGAIKKGAFLLVNSWGTGWGYSVPETGTGGFLWVPYDLPFLSGAYSLNFPPEDLETTLYAKYAVVDSDGSWVSSVVPQARWYDICKFETADPTKEQIDPPVVNGYAQATNRYVLALDASDLFDSEFPAITLSILSSAGAENPEGEIEFSLYDTADDQSPALIATNLSVWGYFPHRRYATICPLTERESDLGILLKYGGMAAADLDGDGAEEFVAGYIEGTDAVGINSGDKNFVLARNDGSGTYTLEALPGDGEHGGQPLLVDLDNDGDLDLVHSSWERTDLLLNNGSGSFSLSGATLPAGGMGGGAATADFNGDGRPDLLLANMDEGLLLMRQLPDGSFEKNPLGRFTPNIVLSVGVDTTCVAAGDVNGDGLPDFVFWEETREGYTPDKLVLGINQGGLNFSYRILPTPDNLQSVAFALGDFDQDGCDDLAWSGCSFPEGSQSYRQARFGVLRGSVSGWMSAVPMAPDLEPVCGGGIAWADMNSDGTLDLLVSGREDDSSITAPTLAAADRGFYKNRFYLLRYDNGYFVESGFNLTGVTGCHRGGLLAPLDIDGDGDLDLFSSGYRGPMRTAGGSDINDELYFSAFYENNFDSFALTRSTNTPPTAPTAFSAVPSANQVRFEWSGATDAETAPDGLRYQLQVGTSSGDCDLLSKTLDPQNSGLLRKSGAVLSDVPAGTLYWRVRTLDASSAVSPWSAQQTVSVSAALAKSRVRIASAEGGTCTPGVGEFLVDSGGSLNLSAQPAAGWQFDGWLVNGALVSADPYALSPSQQWVDVVPQFSQKDNTAPEVGEWSRQVGPAHFMNRFGFSDYAAVALNGYLHCFPGYGNSSQAWRTSNGTSWTRYTFMGGITLPFADAVAWNSKIWLVAESTVYSATQAGTGSLTWSTKTTSAPWGATAMQLAVFNSKLWAVNSGGGGSVWSSTDGINWTQETAAPWPGRPYTRLVVAGDTLLAIISTSSFGTSPGEVWGTTDGVNWTQRCAATPWEHDGSSWGSACFIAAVWFDGAVHVTGMTNTHFVSTDEGVSWIKVHPTGSESSHFSVASAYGCELIVFNGELYLIGNEEDSEDWTVSVFWKLAPSSGGGAVTYALNLSVNGEGGSTMPPAGVWFDEAGSYPLEARPDPGYEFVSWSGPVADPSAAETSVALASNSVVVATFREMDNNVATPEFIPLVTSVFPAGSGRVGQFGNYNLAATQVLVDGSTKVTAVAETGWEFSHWLGTAAAEMLSASTAVIPAGAASVELTACFRPAGTSAVFARGSTSGFIDGSGRQWLWGANRFGVDDVLWDSPDGGLPPFAFNYIDFWDGATSVYALGADGSLRQSGGLRFLEHRFTQVSSGSAYALAINGAGRVWSWGSNAYGQLGDGTLTDRDAPVAVLLPESETFVQVCAGETFGMARSLSGKVYVWGANSSGQTGPAGFVNLVPLEVTGLPVVQDIAAGTDHALALGADGLVYGWGANTYGQSSGRRGNDLDTPAAVESLSVNMQSQLVSIRMEDLDGNSLWDGGGAIVPNGQYFLRAYAEFFVVAEDGERYRFDHWEGPVVEPAAPESTAKAMPNAEVTAVFALKTATLPKLNLSMNHAGAAMISPTTGTTSYAWGEVVELATQPYAGWQFERWIIDGETNLNAAIQLTMDRDVTARAFYSTQPFRTKSVPGLLNSWGQPANVDSFNRSVVNPNYTGPQFVDAVTTSFNGYSKLYLGADGTVWYVNSVPDAMERVPGETVDIPYFGGVKQVVSGSGGFMLAVRFDDSIWVWGNVPGEASPVQRPIQVAGLDAANYRQITAVGGTLLFLHNDGTVSSWGTDTSLTGTGAAHASLTTIPEFSGIIELVGDSFSVQVLKSDGTVWGWGANYWEYLGISWNTLASSATPVQVPGLSNIAKLFAYGFAIDNQDRAWVWGRDNAGSSGLGVNYAHQSILPPILHPTFPGNAVRVSRSGDGYTSVLCDDGSIWRAGNAYYWSFVRLNTEYLIVDTYADVPVHRQLSVTVDSEAADWVSHLSGVHTYMDNDRVLLWADPPITVQCDGWLIDGLPVSSRSVNLLMDRNRTAEPVFSLRAKTELPAPELRIGSAGIDQNTQGQVVRLPITLSSQDYIVPEALQFTVQVPGGLPEPQLTVFDEWRGLIDVITETEAAGTNGGWNLKVLMTSTNDLFSVSNRSLATLSFDVDGVSTGEYPVCILDAQPVMLPVAADDEGSVAVPLNTVDGMLRIETSERCAIKLNLSPTPTAASCLTDAEMETLSDWDLLRQDLSRYAEVWLRCGADDELFACSYNLSVSGSASFTTNRQYFFNEADLYATVSPDGNTLTGMGGPISDEKIITHNDYAANAYESGDWMLIARMPLDGSGGSSTIAMTDIRVELFESDGNETLVLADQTRSLTVAPNAAPTSSDLSISTTSTEFVRIQPEINDVNPQDIDGIGLMILRHPVSGRVIIDPQNPHGFIYHPPENGIFSGIVSFQFALSDGTAVSATYTVEITVNNPPRFIGIPDVIHCGSDTSLSLTVQVSDADTPAAQLAFALHNAPHWLSIVNNGDGSAVISGAVPPTRSTWQVFAVQVSDPLSLATSQATLLLTFDPAEGGVLLTVINGMGTGLFEAGAVQQIFARDPQAGEAFAGWTGDVQFLDDAQSMTPTVTLPDHDITLTAVFNAVSASSGFSDWAGSHGLAAGQDGPTDTPAGDGISNLEKYALGLIPGLAYRPGDLFSIRIDAAAQRIILRYEKSKLADDVQITAVWSPSLTDPVWGSTLIETALVGETDTHEIWEASLPIGDETRYLRLEYQLLSSAPSDSAFSEWVDSYSLAAGQDGPTDTPAGDGISNLEKYALGLIPGQAYSPGDLFSLRIDAAAQRMILRYEKSKSATDVQITPVWSPSLTDPEWNTTLIETAQVGETDTHEIWEASLPISDETRYMSLRFELESSDTLAFAEWVDSYSLGATQDGMMDAPSGDGVSNLEKYAMGWEPMQICDPGDLFFTRVEADRVVVEYEKYKPAAGVSIAVIWSTSLTDPVWRTDLVEISPAGETATHEQWGASIPLPADSPLYVRLQFTAL
jgi:alpha-tubulin suppressor-like RCC1 family protein